MQWSRMVLGILLVLGIAASAGAQQDFDKVAVNIFPVDGNVYAIHGLGGNIGVSAGEDGVLIIDDQFTPLADRIEEAIGQVGEVKPKFVINTHWHGDHTGGNEHFGRTGTIIAHENVRKRLSTSQFIKMFNMKSDPRPKEALPVITFKNSVSVHFNGEEIEVLHFPSGHTDSDSIVIFKGSNVVHMGDHFFSGMFPFIDLDSGGDVEGYTRNVKKIIGMIDRNAKVIPGHGPLSTMKDLKEFYQMLETTTAIIRQRIEQGLSLEECQKAGFPNRWHSFSDGVLTTDQWIAIVYSSLTR